MSRTLIVYHSRSGYTRRIARALARRLDADLDEIHIVQPMGGIVGYTLCAIEAIAGLAPALKPAHRDPAAYDLVVVGTPVWFWSLSSPVRSWLETHPLLRQRVAFFCTMGGSGATRVFDAMSELGRCTPVATLALTDSEIEHRHLDVLGRFVEQLHVPVARSAPRTKAARRSAVHHKAVAA
jgi:flavodoxin